MSKFEVGQKWRLSDGYTASIVDVNEKWIAFEQEDRSLDCSTIEHFEMQVSKQVTEPKYRPFANAAEFDSHRDKWVLSKTGNNRCRVLSYTDARVGLYPDWLLWNTAFESYAFEDGLPFGVEVEHD